MIISGKLSFVNALIRFPIIQNYGNGKCFEIPVFMDFYCCKGSVVLW